MEASADGRVWVGEMRNKIRWGEAGGFLGFGRNNNGLKGLLIIRLAKITPFLGRRSVARARMRQSRKESRRAWRVLFTSGKKAIQDLEYSGSTSRTR